MALIKGTKPGGKPKAGATSSTKTKPAPKAKPTPYPRPRARADSPSPDDLISDALDLDSDPALAPTSADPPAEMLDKAFVLRLIIAKLESSKTCDWYTLSLGLNRVKGAGGSPVKVAAGKKGTGKGRGRKSGSKEGEEEASAGRKYTGSELHDVYHHVILPALKSGRPLWDENATTEDLAAMLAPPSAPPQPSLRPDTLATDKGRMTPPASTSPDATTTALPDVAASSGDADASLVVQVPDTEANEGVDELADGDELEDKEDGGDAATEQGASSEGPDALVGETMDVEDTHVAHDRSHVDENEDALARHEALIEPKKPLDAGRADNRRSANTTKATNNTPTGATADSDSDSDSDSPSKNKNNPVERQNAKPTSKTMQRPPRPHSPGMSDSQSPPQTPVRPAAPLKVPPAPLSRHTAPSSGPRTYTRKPPSVRSALSAQAAMVDALRSTRDGSGSPARSNGYGDGDGEDDEVDELETTDATSPVATPLGGKGVKTKEADQGVVRNEDMAGDRRPSRARAEQEGAKRKRNDVQSMRKTDEDEDVAGGGGEADSDSGSEYGSRPASKRQAVGGVGTRKGRSAPGSKAGSSTFVASETKGKIESMGTSSDSDADDKGASKGPGKGKMAGRKVGVGAKGVVKKYGRARVN